MGRIAFGRRFAVGTRSVLFGAHQFLLHPWFVAYAWWTLYGVPVDPRLWVAFFVHDLGYVGKPNMDGPEGETHPQFGARIMGWLFDWPRIVRMELPRGGFKREHNYKWRHFTLLHSRYYAKSLGMPPSRLCVADKLAIALTPGWLYLPLVRATGEIDEYRAHAIHRIVGNERVSPDERALMLAGEVDWYRSVQQYCRRWAFAHRDDLDRRVDTWTSDARQRATLDASGVWK